MSTILYHYYTQKSYVVEIICRRSTYKHLIATRANNKLFFTEFYRYFLSIYSIRLIDTC